jgi:hypothetical protein
MSERTDRRIRDNRLLLVLIVSIVFIASVGGFLLWGGMHAPDAVQKETGQSANQLIQPAFRNEPLAVTLYYPLDGLLVAGEVSVKRSPDTQSQAWEALAALLQDQRAAQASVLRDIKLRAFFLDSQGTAYVDLAPVQQQPVRASGWDEQLAIYAIVNTLMQNFEEIKQVEFLMNGRDAETLAGHMDLSRKFSKRVDLVRR